MLFQALVGSLKQPIDTYLQRLKPEYTQEIVVRSEMLTRKGRVRGEGLAQKDRTITSHHIATYRFLAEREKLEWV